MTLAAALLAACDEGPATPGAKSGQTIALVNGEEITIHELNEELNHLHARDDADATAPAALRTVVERALLAQKAAELKLHRSPHVMMALRRARTEVLAQAYRTHRLVDEAAVSILDVQRFMKQNPRYFEKREYFALDQVVADSSHLTDDDLETIKKLKTLDEVMERLSAMGVKHVREQNSFFSTDFPKDMLESLDQLAADGIFFMRSANLIAVSRIVDRRPRPLAEQEAFRAAEKYLEAEKRATLNRQIIDSLLAEAQIEYFGVYAFLNAAAAEPAKEGQSADAPSGKDSAARAAGKTKAVRDAGEGERKSRD